MQEIYGNKLDLRIHATSSIRSFDHSFLLPLKKEDITFKGGIYFTPPLFGFHSYKALVNTRSPTSFLTVQTLAMQTYMNYLSGKKSTITIVNAPLPKTFDELSANTAVSAVFAALIFSLALAFKFSSISSFIVRERIDGSKHQQIVSGLNIGSYWFGNYFFDFVLYGLVAAISVGFCLYLDIKSFLDDGALSALILLFILFGLSNIPFTYILTFIFTDPGNAQTGVYFFNFAIAGVAPLIISIFRLISKVNNDVSTGNVVRKLSWFLRLFPGFSFGEGLVNLGNRKVLSLV